MDFTFNLTVNGQSVQIPCNDTFFNYVAYRQNLPEEICLEMIHAIKKSTGKKVAIIYGNCQTAKLQNFFMNNYTFVQEYLLLQIPTVCEYLSDERANLFLENFWSLCDLLISQRVSNNNKYSLKVATQILPTRLPEDTKIIWIPNVYFDGYFPQCKKNPRNVDQHIHEIVYILITEWKSATIMYVFIYIARIFFILRIISVEINIRYPNNFCIFRQSRRLKNKCGKID